MTHSDFFRLSVSKLTSKKIKTLIRLYKCTFRHSPLLSAVDKTACSRGLARVFFMWVITNLPNTTHYANMPMQYTAIFHDCKNDNFQMKNCDIVIFFLLLLKTLIVGTR